VRLAALLALALATAATAAGGEPLPRIGPAPAFTLTAQDDRRVSLADLRGKVLAVTFIYASCVDTCPLLTAKMAGLQAKLGSDFGSRVAFLSITVDPERDTPDVLRRYADRYGAAGPGWWFLTGSRAEIADVTRRYGVFVRKQPHGDVDHTFLTSLVDRQGTLRVQFLGVRYDPDEMLGDLKSLVSETAPR